MNLKVSNPTAKWHTSFMTLQIFKRWAIIITVITALIGLFAATQIVSHKKQGLMNDVIERLAVRTAGRAELAHLWTDNMLDIGSNIVNSELMRLYTTEMTQVNEGNSTKSLSESLKAQQPYMDYMINEFAKQHDLLGASLLDANSTVIVTSDAAPLLSDETKQAIVTVLGNGQSMVLPLRAMGAELVVDVIRPVFVMREREEIKETSGALVTTHNVSTDIARLMESQPLDSQGEEFGLIQQEDETTYSLISTAGLTPVEALPELGEPVTSTLRDDESHVVFAALQQVPGTPFIALGEFDKNQMKALFSDTKAATFGSAIIFILLIMVVALWLLWVLINQYSRQRNRLQDQTMQTLVRAIEIRDPYLAGHHQRLAKATLSVAQELGLSVKERTALYYAAQLSGIGMIFVPQEILTKPGKLTPKERKQLEEHVQHADDVLKGVDFDLPIRDVITQMHERADGSGYPKKLKGGRINELARILGVCDVFCALTSPRIYRQGMSTDQAMNLIDENINQYDAKVVAALKKALQSGKLSNRKK